MTRSTCTEAIRSIMRQRGAAGFYVGFLSTVAREIPFDAIEFGLYGPCSSSAAG